MLSKYLNVRGIKLRLWKCHQIKRLPVDAQQNGQVRSVTQATSERFSSGGCVSALSRWTTPEPLAASEAPPAGCPSHHCWFPQRRFQTSKPNPNQSSSCSSSMLCNIRRIRVLASRSMLAFVKRVFVERSGSRRKESGPRTCR